MFRLSDLYWSATNGIRLPARLTTLLEDCESVLDLGCGWKPKEFLRDKHAVGVDAFQASIDRATETGIYDDLICADIFDAADRFEDDSFDAVTSFDVIEHLTKEDGMRMIEEMKRIGRRKIVILTPNGFINQDEYDDNPLQIHRSGWTYTEMKTLGFAACPMSGMKWFRGEECQLSVRPRFLGQLLSDASIAVTKFRPSSAYQLLCSLDLSR